MKKIIFLMIGIIMILPVQVKYNRTYNYSDDNIIDKDIAWIKEIAKEENTEEKVEEIEEIEEVEEVDNESITDNTLVLASFYGKMSGYGPDCSGCSGFLAYEGIDVRNNIYFDDYEYGKVRIAAADRSIPFGSIIKVNGDFLMIILDRGGGIGFDKRFQFDLLYESEAVANQNGVFEGKFEILRYGF